MKISECVFRLALLVSTSLCFDNFAIARSLFVRTTGNDSNTGTAAEQAFRTIHKATTESAPGDIIFVGAGTYDESVIYNGASKSQSGAWMMLYADQQGTFTGDKGPVTIRPPEKKWALRVTNAKNTLLYGFYFLGNPGSESTSYGSLITNSTGYVYFLNCSFKNLTYGIRNLGDHQLSANGCAFQTCRYGVYSTRAKATSILNCSFKATTYGCIAYDNTACTIARSTFDDRITEADVASDTRGVYAARTALSVQSCSFNRSTLGVYGTQLNSVQISHCEFMKTTSQAVRCDGESMSMSDSIVREGNYGVTLGDTSGNSAMIQRVLVEQMRIGIMAYQGDYDFRDVNLTANKYGLYQRTGNALLTLRDTDQISFTENEYAILANHQPGEDAELNLSGQDLRGNDRGIVAYRTRVTVDSSQFDGTTIGAYVSESERAKFTHCQFFGNEATPMDCVYGLYVKSDETTIHHCESVHARYGIFIDNLTANPADLQNNRSEHCAIAAMYMRNGVWTYTDRDNNVFANSPRGVIARSVSWTIDDVTTSNSCQYPIMDYYGSCTVLSATASGTKTGFYAYQSEMLDVSALTVSGCGSYGMVINDCNVVKLLGCHSSGNLHGAYVVSSKQPFTAISDSTIENNSQHGLLMRGTTIDPTVATNLDLHENKYGIYVIDRFLTLTGKMQVNVSGNQYGVVCRNGDLNLDEIQLSGNAIGAYCHTGSLSIDRCTISADSYGVIGYVKGDCSVIDSSFTDSKYGIYVRAIGALDSPVTLARNSITNTSTWGIYAYGFPGAPTEFAISETQIRNGGRGIVGRDASVSVDQVTLQNLTSVGLYSASGEMTVRQTHINGLTGSWAVLARGDRCDVAQSKIRSSLYGIALLSASGTVTNTSVDGANYGIYLRRPGANYSVAHATVANAKYYGLLRYDGNTVVTNSIFHSAYHGMYDGKEGGTFSHHHNLVFAARQPYINATPGDAEILESPVFSDPSNGDLRLASGSPAINSGIDLSSSISVDLEGNSRPSFRGFEMGAYEYMEPSGSLRVLRWDEVAK